MPQGKGITGPIVTPVVGPIVGSLVGEGSAGGGGTVAPFTVLSKVGFEVLSGRDVLDADGNSFTVTADVLDVDGNSFTCI